MMLLFSLESLLKALYITTTPFSRCVQFYIQFLTFYTIVQHFLLGLWVFSYIPCMCEHLRA